jgi:eukaryotic-like serine/threonine-protein kinase
MTPERWERIQEIFHAAEERPEAERGPLLEELCGADAELRRDVESLLAASAGDELEQAVAGAVEELRREPRPAAPGWVKDYRILRRLGEGGMGLVYEAEQLNPRRTVALKVLRSARHASEHARRLFEREGQALARLKHPGIATIFEAGVAEDGLPFLVMELVNGEPLNEWVKGLGPLRSLRKADVEGPLRLFRAICEAVTYAHQNGVIHRDLKPSNLIVTEQGTASPLETLSGQAPLVKVLDFGLARIVDEGGEESLYRTQTAMVQGSLPYMSPEQARGDGVVDLRTDVYALGVLLYWMLTRQHPYLEGGERSLMESLRLIETAAPKRFSQWTSKWDADLEAIVLKAIEKEPGRRYDSVAALAGDLDRYLSDLPILARPPSTLYQVRMLIRRNRAGFWGLAAAVALLVVFAVTTAVQANRIRVERDRANQEAATAQRVSDFLVDLFRETNPAETDGELTARDLLKAGRARVSEELADQPELRARLLDRIGDAYTVVGPLSEAQSAYEESLKVRAAAFGDGSPESGYSWSGLSAAFHNQGKFEESARAARRALAIEERRLGAEDPELAPILAGLGLSLSASGDAAGALIAIRRAVDLEERHGRDGTMAAADRLQSYGAILRQNGDYRAAIEPLRRAAAIKRKVAGVSGQASVLNELGMALNLLGESAEAEKVLRETLGLVVQVFGEGHANVAMVQTNVAYAVEAQGRGREAEALAREAMAVFDRALGADHPRRSDMHLTLGEALAGQGRVAEARAEFAAARRVALAAWGAEHPRTARATARLGRLEAEEGDARAGVALLEEGRAALKQVEGTPEGAALTRALGEAYLRMGDRERARPLIGQSLERLRAMLGPEHRETRKAAAAAARL